MSESEQSAVEKLAERRAAREARDEASVEARAVLELAVVERLEKDVGEQDRAFRIVPTLDGVLAVKRPHHLVYRQFAERAKTSIKDIEQLVFANLLHPTKAEAQSIFETEPHALVRCADAICWLAGARRDDLAPK